MGESSLGRLSTTHGSAGVYNICFQNNGKENLSLNSIIPPHLKAANLGGPNDPQIYGNTKLCLSWSSRVPSGSSRSTDLFQSVTDDGSCQCCHRYLLNHICKGDS